MVTQDSVQSVRRALKLLSSFTPERTQWSVGDLSRRTGLHKSVVARLMTTMASEGFLIQDEANRTYTVGPQVFAIGNMYEPRLILERLALSAMQELASASGHTCALAIRSGTECMYVMAVENPSPTDIRVGVQPGRRRPFHTSAVGKILLADMPAEEAERIISDAPLTKLTPFSIESVDAMHAELAEIRKTGVALSNQESVLGVGAVAAPVRNANGATLAAITVVFPYHLVNREARKRITRLTLEAAARISERVGWVTLTSAHGRSVNV